MTPHAVEHPVIRFNGRTGYTRHADSVTLFADGIDNLDTSADGSADLALQLWACQTPYDGGNLSGWKLAELPLGNLQPSHCMAPVETQVPASYPESGDFSIAMVLAESDGSGFNRIQDFHNYPYRDAFIHPRFDGTVGYRFLDGNRLAIEAGGIHNPRDPSNISGTLSVELWALAEPYNGGDFQGHALGSVTPGCLAGDDSWRDCSWEIDCTVPKAGTYTLALMLREWTGTGYVTRDHSNFSQPVTFPLAASAPAAAEAVVADEPHGQAANAAPALQPDSPDTASESKSDEPAPSTAQPNEHAPDRQHDILAAARALIEDLKTIVGKFVEKFRQRSV